MRRISYEDHKYGEIVVYHNSDFFGDVHITIPKTATQETYDPNRVEVHLPFELLQDVVMAKIRSEMIAKLEEMTGSQLSDLLSLI